ncbi:MAG: hypothetical protein WBA07_34210 [Rivularia sp. (in: cyanobacteria)]
MLTHKSNRYFAGFSASFVHRNSFGGELNDAAHKNAIARKKNWTVASLAEQVPMSRSAFAA